MEQHKKDARGDLARGASRVSNMQAPKRAESPHARVTPKPEAADAGMCVCVCVSESVLLCVY